MTHYLPNKSLRERGIKNHLQTLGIDVELFGKFIEAKIPVANMRMFFKKSDGKLYARKTLANWVKLYKEAMQ